MNDLLQDIRFAFRGLRRSSGFTTAAVTLLALGIGVNAAVFVVTKAALFAGFPLVVENDRLVYISHRGCCVSYPDFLDWRAQAKSFEGMALVRGVQRTLRDEGGLPETYEVTEVTADTFALVGQRPMLGRDFAPSDQIAGAPPVAILSYAFWERRFGRNPAILGDTVRISGVPTTVIGIMPEGFSFPQKLDLWVPLTPTTDVRRRDARNTWFVFGRMADGVSIESARAEMEIIGQRLERAHPLTNKGVVPQVQNFRAFFIFENEDTFYAAMWGAVGFVLLIACANLANLLLARAAGRSREMSVRIALGAGQWRIIRQLLIESLMLAGAGAIFGWWIAKWGVRAYALADRGPGRSSWRILDYSMDHQVLWYFIAVAVGTALLFGLAPALRLARVDVNTTLKDGGRGAVTGRRRTLLPNVLVTVEIALAVVLLAGAGVMIRSFLNVYRADTGVDTAKILTVSIDLPATTYASADRWVSFFEQLRGRLEAIPGVESIAVADRLPTNGGRRFPYELARGPSAGEQRPTVAVLTVGPAYFATVGAAILSGRDFHDTDGESGPAVALVNRQFASTHWPGENPLGQRLRLFDRQTPQEWATVVGVVSNIEQDARTPHTFDPLVYLPYRQRPLNSMHIVARTRVLPEGLRTAFARDIMAVDPDLPVFGPFTLAERLQGNYWSSGLYGVLFLMFAAVALLLASLGVYAVMAHSATLRAREIGVRLALGATASDIRKLVIVQGARPLGTGLVIGARFVVCRQSPAEIPTRPGFAGRPFLPCRRLRRVARVGDAGLLDTSSPRRSRRSARDAEMRVTLPYRRPHTHPSRGDPATYTMRRRRRLAPARRRDNGPGRAIAGPARSNNAVGACGCRAWSDDVNVGDHRRLMTTGVAAVIVLLTLPGSWFTRTSPRSGFRSSGWRICPAAWASRVWRRCPEDRCTSTALRAPANAPATIRPPTR